jgi:hypothetical protein
VPGGTDSASVAFIVVVDANVRKLVVSGHLGNAVDELKTWCIHKHIASTLEDPAERTSGGTPEEEDIERREECGVVSVGEGVESGLKIRESGVDLRESAAPSEEVGTLAF